MTRSASVIQKVALLALLSLSLFSCAATNFGAPTLVVASDLDNAPFAWIDDEGDERGRDVEMMELLAADLGVRLEWSRMPFDQLLDECEAGRVDVVCATLGITMERAKRVLFTTPYFHTAIAVVVRVGEGEPDDLASLAGRRVAAGVGTTSQFAVQAHLPKAIGVFEPKENQTTAERLLTRDVDAAVMDGPAAAAMVLAASGRLRLLIEPLATERYALCVPRTRGDLVRKLDLALKRLRDSGQLVALNAKHQLISSKD